MLNRWGPDAGAFQCPVDHRSLRCHFSLTDGGADLHIDDHGISQIDEVVGAVGEEGLRAMGARPACRWISRRLIFGRDGRRRSEGHLVEHLQILPNSMIDDIRREPLCAGNAALAIGVGLDQTGVHGKAFATDQSFLDAARDGHLEQLP